MAAGMQDPMMGGDAGDDAAQQNAIDRQRELNERYGGNAYNVIG